MLESWLRLFSVRCAVLTTYFGVDQSRGYSKMKQFQGVESRVFKQEASDYDAVQARDNEENDAPLYAQKHKNFLKKKSGD